MKNTGSQQVPKVLQFTCPGGFYGAERWIIALAKNLDATTVSCPLAVLVETGGAHQELAREYRNLQKNVFEIKAYGRFDLTVIWRLAKLIRREKIDIIHSHSYKSDILGLIAARLCGIRAITTPHGFVGLNDWKLKLYYWLGNKFFKWFDFVVPLSRQLREDVLELGVNEEKVRYIRNGVDLDEIDAVKTTPNDETSKPAGKRRIGYIGQITQRKNIDHILAVFDRLHTDHPELELVLLGDGDQQQEMQEHATTLQSSDAIQFAGFQPNRLHWLKTFDLFVMTSKLEGIPRCLMEAMAMKIPVAAYQIPGVDQLVTHEETGLLADYADQKMLADYWRRILYEDDLAESLAESGRQFILEKFSGKRMADEYVALYRELIR